MSTCLPICLLVYLFVYSSTCWPVNLSTYGPTYHQPDYSLTFLPVIYQSVYLATYLPIFLPVYLSTYLPVYFSTIQVEITCLLVYLTCLLMINLDQQMSIKNISKMFEDFRNIVPTYLAICLPIYMFICIPVYLSTCLLFYLFTWQPVYLSTFLLAICQYVYLPTYLPIF